MPSVFANHVSKVFTFRKVDVQFTSRIFGGIPLRPDVIEAWLRKNTGITNQQELAAVVKRTLAELDPDLAERSKTMTAYELMQLASEKLAASQSSVGFKVDEQGLFIESRQIKAGLREATNILFAGDRWGPTKKGPKSWLAERVFVGPERIHLLVPGGGNGNGLAATKSNGKGTGNGRYAPAKEPTGIDLFVGHVTGPQGPRSTLTYYQYVQQARISFLVATVQDDVIAEKWPDVWSLLEMLGFGALRSQDAGRFEVTHWDFTDPVPLASLRPVYDQELADREDAEAARLEAAIVEQAKLEAAAAGRRR